MHKKIVVILGHPDKDSYCGALADEYSRAAKSSGAKVRQICLGDMQFDPILWKGYKVIQKLEPCLVQAQEDIKWADHIVFVYPIWWGVMPALMKGFIDRIFLPGFGFNFRKGSLFWDKHLRGKSARLIVTMNAPSIVYRLMLGAPGHKMMKTGVLGFCGVRPVRITEFNRIEAADHRKRERWLQIVRAIGDKQE